MALGTASSGRMRPGIRSPDAQKSVRAAIIATPNASRNAFGECLAIRSKTGFDSRCGLNGWISRFAGGKPA